MSWTIVKVGGSLYDWPMLGERLRAWLHELNAERVLIVPGGGAAADAVRAYDGVHQLGEEASHWLAIQAVSLNARLLQQLLPEANVIADPRGIRFQSCNAEPHDWNRMPQVYILDAYPFFQADEQTSAPLPHRWHVTSDSLAVRVAALTDARELILLKSMAWAGDHWTQAVQAGVVDGYFAEALKQTPASLRTRIVNLQAWSPRETSVSSSPTR